MPNRGSVPVPGNVIERCQEETRIHYLGIIPHSGFGTPSFIDRRKVSMSKQRYFLAKSEPDVYSIDDLERDGRTTWDGVRNPQARIAIRTMEPGDLVLIYHSGGISAVVGVAKVLSAPVDAPDDQKMTVVELEFVHKLSASVSLKAVKESGLFADFNLVRNSRLSTMEAPASFIAWLKKQRPELKKVM